MYWECDFAYVSSGKALMDENLCNIVSRRRSGRNPVEKLIAMKFLEPYGKVGVIG
jgi:hypothetical protein